MELEFKNFNDIYDGTLELYRLSDSDGYITYSYTVKPGEQLLFTTINDINIEVNSLRQGRIYEHCDPLEIKDTKGKRHYFDNPITEGHFTLIKEKK